MKKIKNIFFTSFVFLNCNIVAYTTGSYLQCEANGNCSCSCKNTDELSCSVKYEDLNDNMSPIKYHTRSLNLKGICNNLGIVTVLTSATTGNNTGSSLWSTDPAVTFENLTDKSIYINFKKGGNLYNFKLSPNTKEFRGYKYKGGGSYEGFFASLDDYCSSSSSNCLGFLYNQNNNLWKANTFDWKTTTNPPPQVKIYFSFSLSNSGKLIMYSHIYTSDEFNKWNLTSGYRQNIFCTFTTDNPEGKCCKNNICYVNQTAKPITEL